MVLKQFWKDLLTCRDLDRSSQVLRVVWSDVFLSKLLRPYTSFYYLVAIVPLTVLKLDIYVS